MSLRRAARVFACLAFASLVISSPSRADEAITVDHAPELLTKVYQVADLIVPLTSTDPKQSQADYEWLVDLIELRTGADCWPQGGGQGMITPHEKTMSLVIRQTRVIHERIADMLDEIRGTADLGLCIEIQLIHGNLDACGESKPHRTAQGLVDAAGKQRLLQSLADQKDGKVIAAPKITFFNGTTASMETNEQGCSKSFNVRGVISKDNRYARLWLEAKVDGQMTKAEVIVPEGHTAVRKLPGENSWLLLTSHVINAEEPQVIAAPKHAAPQSIEQKRYLVPVDESPEPGELAGVPQFKAQAESFGLAIQRAKVAIEAVAEKSAAAAESQPELAAVAERVEYQVAQAEPRHLTGVPVVLQPPAVAFVDLGDVHFTTPADADQLGGLTRRILSEERPASTFEMHPSVKPRQEGPGMPSRSEYRLSTGVHAPYRLWLGDVLENTGFAQNDRCVTNTINVEPAAVEPPARLDVCLDDLECQPAPKGPVPFSQVIDGIFVSPSPSFPVPWIEFNRPSPNATVTIVPTEVGRRAILTKPKTRSPVGVALLAPAPSNKVEPASGTQAPVETIESHLTTAAIALEELGLTSEAMVVEALLQSIHVRAEERCLQIDQEIAKLKAARKKLQDLANPEVAGGTESPEGTR